jgi:diadenosine tetraphosphate (Ap4A) HIT family hydrolase
MTSQSRASVCGSPETKPLFRADRRLSKEIQLPEQEEAASVSDPPVGYRYLDFLGGPSHLVHEDTCRGCFMNLAERELSDLLAPVYDDGLITVRQDAEWAVPGFMVVGVRQHIGSLDEMNLQLVGRLARVTHFVRRAMRERLGLTAVQMYQEEKLDRPHFHTWMLPLWPDTMSAHRINPRIYESNIARYLTLFALDSHEAAIRRCSGEVRSFLGEVPELRAAAGA